MATKWKWGVNQENCELMRGFMDTLAPANSMAIMAFSRPVMALGSTRDGKRNGVTYCLQTLPRILPAIIPRLPRSHSPGADGRGMTARPMMYSANFKSDGIESKLSPPAAGASAPIDLDHLRRYTFSDRGLEKEVLSLFLAQIPETMAALRAASTERDWHIAAHTLKGSSRAVGAWQLGNLAATAEAQPQLTEGTARIATFANLQDAISAVQAFILSAYGAA